MWRPGHKVDGCRVQGDFVDFLPGGGLLAPDEDFAVVGRGREDVAIFGVGPGYAPYCAFVSSRIECQ